MRAEELPTSRNRSTAGRVVCLLWLAVVFAIGDASSKPARAASDDSITIPFTREGAWIIVEAGLNGHRRQPFLLDTGAQNTVTPDVAKALELATGGRHRLYGFGRNSVVAGEAEVETIDLDGVLLHHEPFFVGPLPNTLLDRGKRPRMAGILGPDLFRHFVVRIDYGQQRLELTPFSTFRYEGSGFSLPLTVPMALSHLGGLPSVPASLDGIQASFAIDTGFNGGLHLYPEFGEIQNLGSKYGKYVHVVTAGGIGGHNAVNLALAQSFGLGSSLLPRPLVSLPDGGSPTKSAKLSAGLIGGGLLARFIPTFDFQHLRLYLEPTAAAQRPGMLVGTGLSVTKDDHAYFTVIGVIPGTPRRLPR